MTPRNKKESALGKGLDALIRKDYLDDEKSAKTREDDGIKTIDKTDKFEQEEPELYGSKSEAKPDQDNLKTLDDTSTDVLDEESFSADEKVIEAVLKEVHKNPRISLWSAKSAAVLRFLKKTKPEFSISSEASLLIEEAVKERHPEIWKLFEKQGL